MKNPLEYEIYLGEKMERTDASLFFVDENRTPLLCMGTGGGLVLRFYAITLRAACKPRLIASAEERFEL